jgi:hypothetical protein
VVSVEQAAHPASDPGSLAPRAQSTSTHAPDRRDVADVAGARR